MPNFAVCATDEVISKGNTLLERIGEPHEKKGETLSRLFDLAAAQLDGETIRKGGVDIEALDDSLDNIRNQFITAVSGKKQLEAYKDTQIQEIRDAKARSEEELKKKIGEAETAKQQAEAAASAAREESERSRKELERANGVVQCIDSIQNQLAEAREKEKKYDTMLKENQAAQEQLRTLEQKLRDQESDAARQTELLKKDYEAQIHDLQTKMEHMISDTKKDAALAQAEALAAKEREMNAAAAGKLHEIEKENIRLQIENESLRGLGPGKTAAGLAGMAPTDRTLMPEWEVPVEAQGHRGAPAR